jgi:hypothetical protein
MIYSKPSLIRLQLFRMSDNPDRNMKKCCSQLSTCFKRYMTFRKADKSLVWSDKIWQFLQTCITTFKYKYNFWVFYWWINILSYYILNKGSTVIFCYLFPSALLKSSNFPFISVPFCFSLRMPFASLIRMTSLSQLTRISEGFCISLSADDAMTKIF